ncbi:hypothetical protein [Arthrobacter sp. lap29]|uniref:hypothetical protein n=1 Tax=Arthrobacter sp. lap29 TaxID=3056122 RepID=UPI0028F6C8CF|nr:hypothetical protein [Arthrobacter sp. lap29]
MSVNSKQPSTPRTATRALPLLLVIPACALIASIVLWLILSPLLPNQIARHVGPDGVGYSPTILVLAVLFGAAAVPFLIGVAQEQASSNSVAMGLLGFLLLFIAAAIAYSALLPRAEPEPAPC